MFAVDTGIDFVCESWTSHRTWIDSKRIFFEKYSRLFAVKIQWQVMSEIAYEYKTYTVCSRGKSAIHTQNRPRGKSFSGKSDTVETTSEGYYTTRI